MRVDLSTSETGPPEKGTTGRAGQAEGAGTGASSALGGNSVSNSASATDSTTGADQARFSFNQTRVQSLEAQVLAEPEIREAKVQGLQQAIGNGEYSVLAGQIADALASEYGGAQG
jgi:flagellar biosynthesis anti-sigma factor FlgM